ncbi:ABC transporter substrate-binding protein [Leptolyngbya sp. NIES-2104]|uniref:ABC transporter substrate-binding protein n=1 Tax=Leptolyngbya sp. NIES-2104 TaxID=1552121 RepID=UPI0006ECB00F|nr:ABC transporter substrate-binding protein [Leptolyngbya sp. NIES-2104]GAP97496.1 N-Acetyl-D-glucosamine ABC transport system, sugar-binding protein [Leptolyngbya sp. NIES-2104]
MRKLIPSSIAIALLCFTVGCRSNNTNQVEITLSGWQANPNEGKLLDQTIREFEAKNPTIKVKREVINSQYMDVIRTRLIGEVAPDVFYLEAFEAPTLMKFGVLEPLNSYIKPDFKLNDFEPNLLNAFKRDGKVYGIPKDFSTLALFYNSTALKNAGITQPPRTWDELRTAAKKLTSDKNGKIDRYGMGVVPELPRQTFMIKAFGGQLVDPNNYAAFASPEGLKGLELVIDQYRRDRTAAQASDVGANSNSEAFGQGRVAMTLDGAWAIPYLKETFPKLKFQTAEVPKINDRQGTMLYTVAYVMNRQSKQKDAAWKLIQYLTDEAGMKRWANQGVALPSRRSVLAGLNYDRNPIYSPFVSGAKYGTIWQAGETLPTIVTSFDNQFVSALLGQQPLPEAMKRAQDTANREIYLSR